MQMEDLGVKSEQFLFKMQVAVRKTLEINSNRAGMSKAEYLINLIIDDSPYLKAELKDSDIKDIKRNLKLEHKRLKGLKKKLLEFIEETLW